jgi:hypothetical protein
MTHIFCTLDSQRIADLIRSAERFVCYAGPGVQMAPAQVSISRKDNLSDRRRHPLFVRESSSVDCINPSTR